MKTRICVVVLAGLLFSWPPAAVRAGSPEPPDAVTRAIDEVVLKVKPALVQIRVVAVKYNEGQEKKFVTYGSGTIIDRRGYILTNHHVAGHSARLFCILANKEELEAELVGTDPLTDVAVIRIKGDGKREFPAAIFGDSAALKVGDTVLAMGSPQSISQSVTWGIVSNTEMTTPRLLEDYGFQFLMDGEEVGSLALWIAHDAAIYGGNSGGPLMNLKAEIVGVNEISLGLGGAIPGNLARSVAEQLMAKGHATRAWLGLEAQKLLKNDAPRTGALVSGTIAGSPAEKAGFRSGDVLIRLNGKKVDAGFREQLPLPHQTVADLPIGQAIEAVVLRKGVETALKVTATEREPMELKTVELKPWGITAGNISLLAAKELKRETRDGVLVTSCRPGGPCDAVRPSRRSTRRM
ncbi:MAG: trypsin-like peptidase domain-containing protein [Verrucomicrobiota bacterium]|nr:trypsin-like peptidase domain-containing protein [Verrucomicrobiota bacterium]